MFQVFREVDSMEHILTACRALGRETIWQLALDAVKRKCGKRLEPAVDTLTDLLEKRNAGDDRLARIILTESSHLIWSLTQP